MKNVLLIEDEDGLRTTLCDRFRSEGYDVDSASDGEEGYRKAEAGGFDLIVLDVMLPGKSGFDVCRDLRRQDVSTPILLLTARDETVEKVLGLKLGADDYLTKPFETMELLARMEALLRRSSQPAANSTGNARFGRVRFDARKPELVRDGRSIPLSAKEFLLLRYFLEQRGTVLTREQILREVWGYEASVSSRTLDVHVAWLRQKMEEDPKQPRWILTVHGLGYRFSD